MDKQWVVIGDQNYRRSSWREHAAVITRSFAGFYEANLKKPEMLPLTFANEGDYGLIQTGDNVWICGFSLWCWSHGKIGYIFKKWWMA